MAFVGKGENAGNQYFLPFQQYFLPNQGQNSSIKQLFIPFLQMLSTWISLKFCHKQFNE